MRRATRRAWKVGLGLAVALGAPGCSNRPGCSSVYVGCYGITVLAPDGSRVCDAVVTAHQVGSSAPVSVMPGGFEAECAYEADTGVGDYVITAHKAGYLDAHATIHVSNTGGDCPQECAVAELHLARADGGGSDGSAPDSGAAPDAGE